MYFLELVLIKYLLGYFLQSMAAIVTLYALGRRKLDQKFILISVIFAVLIYIIRHLPIVFGVHTLLILALMFTIGIFILKLNLYAALIAVMILFFSTSISEISVSLFFNGIYGYDTVKRFAATNDLNLAIVGFPTNILLIIIVCLIYNGIRKLRKKIII